MDKGYDKPNVYFDCAVRDIAPVIPLRQTPDVKRGEGGAPDCEHGLWQSLVLTASVGLRSGAPRPASAPPRPCGSRPTG